MREELRTLASIRSLELLALAALITASFSFFGIDWAFYTATRGAWLQPIVYAAGFGGFIFPAVIPLCMYVLGFLRGDAVLRRNALAVLRAIVYALAIIAVLKAVTGRSHPAVGIDLDQDITRQFDFGILQRGIFWGWPSSHAGVAAALSTTLIGLYKSRAIRSTALIYAVVVALGAAIGFHWLSDVVAGTIIGIAVGQAVSGRFDTIRA